MKKKNYIVKIKVITGMHIGVGNDRPEIGGIDNPFIKDPVTQIPYIPGSSLKGKIRSLLETETEEYKIIYEDGKEKINLDIQRIFGGGDEPTRLIFRDLKLTNEYLEKYKTGELQTETKTEVKISRKTGKAAGSGPRTTERIPPDTEFEGEILVRYLDEKDLTKTLLALKKGVELINNDYLGGSGSRGYGAINLSIQPEITEIKSESK